MDLGIEKYEIEKRKYEIDHKVFSKLSISVIIFIKIGIDENLPTFYHFKLPTIFWSIATYISMWEQFNSKVLKLVTITFF